jgi:hypothetical protein
MAESSSKSLAIVAIGTTGCLLAVNAVWYSVSGYPIVYCYMGSFVGALYLTYASVVLMVVAAYTAFQLFRRQSYPALGGVVVIIGIIELPRWMEQMFRLGGTCG